MRGRLTLWYAAVLTGVLALFAAFTLSFLYLSLRRELDATLHAEYEEAEEHVKRRLDDRLPGGGPDDGRALVEVWSADARLLYRSPRLDPDGLGGPPTATPEPSPRSRFLRDGTPVRIRSGLHHLGGYHVVLRVGLSEEGLLQEWHRLRLGILLGLAAAVAIAGLGGHWLAGRALSPLDRLARQAEKLTVDNLGERLSVENPDDELGHLTRVFNLSLARIEDSFARLRRFTADASHELRTPLTVIRAVGEVALQGPQKPERYRETIGSMLEEVDRLSRLVESLLLLSRADAEPSLVRGELGLLELVKGSVSLLEILAEEKAQRLEVRGEEEIRIVADPVLLRQALLNLTDNAIKYSPSGSTITIEVRRSESGEAVVEVRDEGPGIAAAHRSRVFDRFYRTDRGRSRAEGGAGLGLSIARWAVERHGGQIQLESEEGSGSTFRIVLLPGKTREATDPSREV